MNDQMIDFEDRDDDITVQFNIQALQIEQLRHHYNISDKTIQYDLSNQQKEPNTSKNSQKESQEPSNKANDVLMSQNALSVSQVNQTGKQTNEIQTFKQRLHKFRNFEEYRNNTSYFDLNDTWLQLVDFHYQQSYGRKILQKHQFQTVMYMAGQFMGKHLHPRGLLLFHVMGSGKTLTNIASGLYCLARVPVYTKKSKLIFICNKALQVQIQNEVSKYVGMLNKHHLDESFQRVTDPLKEQDYLDKCVFITFNDGVSLNQSLLKGFDVIQNGFVIFDEVHNLFKSISNDSTRGNLVYHHLMSKHLQIQFNSGTPFGNDIKELGICFNILSGNPDLFPVSSLASLFIQSSPEANDQIYIKNKQVLMRRITGLVSSAEIDSQNENYPQMKPLQLVQIPIAKSYMQLYTETRKQNLRSQQFMSDSHLLDNAHISPDSTIVSSKFAMIKAQIELEPTPQIVYSQFVQLGTILFSEYCIQQNTGKPEPKYIWRKFNHTLNQQYETPSNEIIFALIHGGVDNTERMRIIGIFNSPENVNGALINVLCISKASVEGINLKYIRKVHIMEAQWESRDIQQVMSRGQRMFSHSLLPVNQRVIKPYIYISYTNDTKYAFVKDIYQMSTDQQIYFKQQSLIPFQNTLFTLLHFVSFNCKSLTHFAFMDQLFRPDFHKACFTCEADNKQLFNPKFIHQDISINNCRTPQKVLKILQFTYQEMEYGITVDMYAPYGFNVFEMRDKYQRPLDYTKPTFLPIFILAKEVIQKQMKKGITVEDPMPDIQINQNNGYHSTDQSSQFMPYVVITDDQLLQRFSQKHQTASRNLLQMMKASSISFNMQIFNQFKKYIKIDTQLQSNDMAQESLTLFSLFKRFSEQPEAQSQQLQGTFLIGQTQYSFIEFVRRIIKPFYIYLVEYIHFQIRNAIKVFFEEYNQVIIVAPKENMSLMDVVELKLHKTLIRTLIGQF